MRVTWSSRLTNGPPFQTWLIQPASQMSLVSMPVKATNRAVLFQTLICMSSPGELVKVAILIQYTWAGSETLLLRRAQVVMIVI